MTEVVLADLDPGIREAVRLLRANGFDTVDSGDGLSKSPDPDVLPFPHVFVLLPSDVDVREACFAAFELDYSACGLEPPTPTLCEVSFSAIDQKTVLMIGWQQCRVSMSTGDVQ